MHLHSRKINYTCSLGGAEEKGAYAAQDLFSDYLRVVNVLK